MGGSWDGPQAIFEIKYNELYYPDLIYSVNEDKYCLKAASDPSNNTSDDEYPYNQLATSDLCITESDLKNVYIRPINDNSSSFKDIKYYQPFK